jgi:hypothetical protein
MLDKEQDNFVDQEGNEPFNASVDFTDFVDGFVGDVRGYVSAQRRYLELKGAYKIGRLSSEVVQRVALFVGLGFALLFLGVALALYLGELLASYPLGFLITASFALLVLGVFHLWWNGSGRNAFILSRINDITHEEAV